MIARFWGRARRLTPWPSSQPPPADPVQLGEAAKRLLDDPTLQAALERIQQRLFRTWCGTATGNSAGREEAYRLWWAVEELKAELGLMLGDARGQARQAENRRAA